MIGTQVYPEGSIQPERGAEHNWHVWCHTGAKQVLKTREYEQWLAEHPGESYTINFANSSAARIFPGHSLWVLLGEIAERYLVQIFRLTLTGGYVDWEKDADYVRCFDAISIEAKPTAKARPSAQKTDTQTAVRS
jgi:hypothetical protein